LQSGEIVDVSQNTPVIEDGEFHDVNGFQIGLLPMAAANIPLAKNVFLSPGIMFYLPFTQASSYADNFRLHYLRISLELRVALKLRRSR
jgi:hypothetical protein